MVAALVASGVVGGVVAVRLNDTTPAEAQPNVLTGGRFVLLDQAGIQRGVLEVTPDGSSRLLVTGANSQTPRVSVAVDAAGGPRVTLRAAGGATRAVLDARSDGATGLNLLDVDGETRASLSVEADGSPSLSFFDADGEEIWSAP
jgi:hypothetical protein